MRRLLARMDRLDPTRSRTAAPSAGPASALGRAWGWRRRSGNRRRTLAVAVLWLVLGVGGTGWVLHGLQRLGVPVAVDRVPSAEVYSAIVPPPTEEEAMRPLGRPPRRTGTGGYLLLGGDARHPVAYDPCRPIHYVVRHAGEPAEATAGLREAVAAVSAATGLRFVADGDTLEPPSDDREPYQPQRYGKRWAPVLIAFTDPSRTAELKGDVIGAAGSVRVEAGSEGTRLSAAVYVTGQVRLDLPQLLGDAREQRPGRDLRSLTRLVAQHELAHLVGLNHVEDEQQLMFAELRKQTGFAAGDLRGLAVLGRGACVPSV